MSTKAQLEKDKALSLVGCGYIYGATGWICTEAYIKQQAARYPDYAANIYKYGPKWIGKRCYDCAQLTLQAAKAAGVALPSGATSQWSAKKWAQKGTIGTLPRDKVAHLFIQKGSKMSHTGLYLGDGTAIEARGHAYGVQHRALSAQKWTHWAILDYDGTGTTDSSGTDGGEHGPAGDYDTIRKGASGALVVEMQGLLLRHGYSVGIKGADGKFGADTEHALKEFQKMHGLVVDGICGPKSWAALLSGLNDPGDTSSDDGDHGDGDAVEDDDGDGGGAGGDPWEGMTYTVTVPGVDAATATYLLETYKGASAVEDKSDG